jgi:hypothetical protein
MRLSAPFYWFLAVEFVLCIVYNSCLLLYKFNCHDITQKRTAFYRHIQHITRSKLRDPNIRHTHGITTTDSGRYLHFKSNHPRSVKVCVASCLLQRAETHCNEEQVKQNEIAHVKSTLKNIGYPKNVFGEIEKNRTRKEQIKQVKKKEFKDVVVIPYVAGLSEAIRRAGDEVGVRTVFSANDTLKKGLTHVKPKSDTRE